MGYQCVDCVAAGSSGARRPVNLSGAPVSRGRPVVVPTLIAVNVAIFALTVIQSGSLSGNDHSALFDRWGLLPMETANGAWWQLITAGFLHYGPIHIAMNMISLWIIGQSLELALGRLRFTVGYLAARIGGCVGV